MIQATIFFDKITEQRIIEAAPKIGEMVAGPDGAPWRVIGIFRRGDIATITAAPEPLPEWIRGDDTPCLLTS